MPTVTVTYLRDLARDLIAPTISIHRYSRESTENDYDRPMDELPTPEEVDDFLCCNPLLDSDTVAHLVDPTGYLGMFGSTATVSDAWLSEFKEHVSDWASTQEWAAADLIPYHDPGDTAPPPDDHELFMPPDLLNGYPTWFSNCPAHLLLAEQLIRKGRVLSELHWRDFEKLIGELLETQGWEVTLMKGSKDGGIDVLAEKSDPTLGALKAIWQAKKYDVQRKVRLSHLRELSAVVERERATKGVLITTSSFTKGAFDWVKRDMYRLQAKDGKEVERWVRSRLYGIQLRGEAE